MGRRKKNEKKEKHNHALVSHNQLVLKPATFFLVHCYTQSASEIKCPIFEALFFVQTRIHCGEQFGYLRANI